jgi:NADPH:quinone reductase-like Zn-dependent oxidoreductase
LYLARAFGAEELVVASHDDKLARATTLGTTTAINLRQHPA